MAVVVVQCGSVVPSPREAPRAGESTNSPLGESTTEATTATRAPRAAAAANGPAAASTAPLCRRRHWSARSKDVSPPARAVAPVPLAAIVPRNVERSTWTENCRSTRIKSGRSRACRTGVSPRGGGLCGGGRLTRSRSGSGSGTDALRPSSSWR